MLVRNVSRFGDLFVPSLRRVVPAGAVVRVTTAQGSNLLEQPDTWEQVNHGDDDATATPAAVVRIVCTGAGSHRYTVLAAWAAHDRGDRVLWAWSASHHRYTPPDPSATPGGPSRTAYRFACPRCTRRPLIARERLTDLLDGARRAGITDLDVSALRS